MVSIAKCFICFNYANEKVFVEIPSYEFRYYTTQTVDNNKRNYLYVLTLIIYSHDLLTIEILFEILDLVFAECIRLG